MKTIIFCFLAGVALLAGGCDDEADASGPTTAGAGGGATTTSSASQTSSSAGGAGGAGGAVGAGGAGGSGGGGSACVAPDVLSTLNAHMQDLFATTSVTGGHPSAAETTSFFLAPGLPAPPALSAAFASLFMPCSMATLYDPFCEEGRCSRIECTGDGASWIVHGYLDAPPFTSGDWSFATVDLDNSWADGTTGTTFTITVAATGPGGSNWEMTGSGSMDLGVLEVTETFPQLFADGAAVLTYQADSATAMGSIEVAGVEVAAVGPNHLFAATGNCP